MRARSPSRIPGHADCFDQDPERLLLVEGLDPLILYFADHDCSPFLPSEPSNCKPFEALLKPCLRDPFRPSVLKSTPGHNGDTIGA
jgi:hypothetical protein